MTKSFEQKALEELDDLMERLEIKCPIKSCQDEECGREAFRVLLSQTLLSQKQKIIEKIRGNEKLRTAIYRRPATKQEADAIYNQALDDIVKEIE